MAAEDDRRCLSRGSPARRPGARCRLVLHHSKNTLGRETLELLAADWRGCPQISAQLNRLDGLGAPAERLETLYAELTH